MDSFADRQLAKMRREGGSVHSVRTTASSMMSPTTSRVFPSAGARGVAPSRARSPVRQQQARQVQEDAEQRLQAVAGGNASRHADSEARLVAQARSRSVARDVRHDAQLRLQEAKDRQVAFIRKELAQMKTEYREYESMPVKKTQLGKGLSEEEKDEILTNLGTEIAEQQALLDGLTATERVMGKPAEVSEIPRAGRSASPPKPQIDRSHFGGGSEYRSASPSRAGGGARASSPSKPRMKEGGIVKAKRVGKPSSWISHVKAYQTQHGCSYRDAMVKAKATYQK
jgi:hypothetical protein